MIKLITLVTFIVGYSTIGAAQESADKLRRPIAQQAVKIAPVAVATQATPSANTNMAATRVKAATEFTHGEVQTIPLKPKLPSGAPCTSAPVTGQSYGYDANRGPYIETTHTDGSIRREFQGGVEITDTNGSVKWYPAQFAYSHAQPPTPPELPSDPERGLRWLQVHNDALKQIIDTYLRSDQASIDRYAEREQQDAGTDLFKLITYRTQIAAFYASKKQ